MAGIRGSSLPITATITGVDLSLATITMTFALKKGLSPALTKTTTSGAITVAVTDGNSVLSLTLTDAETANWRSEVIYTIYVGDGSAGGNWIPDDGGVGVIQFVDSVKKT